jgi:hypothetical protein
LRPGNLGGCTRAHGVNMAKVEPRVGDDKGEGAQPEPGRHSEALLRYWDRDRENKRAIELAGVLSDAILFAADDLRDNPFSSRREHNVATIEAAHAVLFPREGSAPNMSQLARLKVEALRTCGEKELDDSAREYVSAMSDLDRQCAIVHAVKTWGPKLRGLRPEMVEEFGRILCGCLSDVVLFAPLWPDVPKLATAMAACRKRRTGKKSGTPKGDGGTTTEGQWELLAGLCKSCGLPPNEPESVRVAYMKWKRSTPRMRPDSEV